MQETASNESAAVNIKKTVAMDNTAEEPVANESTTITDHCDISPSNAWRMALLLAAAKKTLRKKWSQKVEMVEPTPPPP